MTRMMGDTAALVKQMKKPSATYDSAAASVASVPQSIGGVQGALSKFGLFGEHACAGDEATGRARPVRQGIGSYRMESDRLSSGSDELRLISPNRSSVSSLSALHFRAASPYSAIPFSMAIWSLACRSLLPVVHHRKALL